MFLIHFKSASVDIPRSGFNFQLI